ncbi:MAG: metallophosphoesterase [Chloroflexota bacterium]|nr:MAG: metallophosphoesterase [Chloroflexota bacterium]
MRCAIVSDIHSNLAAFRAVLAHAEQQGGYETIWCLGDVVGYGPRPNECVDLLRGHPHVCVAGNHDWAAVGKLDLGHFNDDAAIAALWTRKVLRQDIRRYLLSLPIVRVEEEFTLAHGSPREPIWEYLTSATRAAASLESFQTRFCLVGHTHIPIVFRCQTVGGCCVTDPLEERTSLIAEPSRLIINPGSVGQPRDEDPRASYAILDTVRPELQHYRVEYDIASVQEEIYDADLPPFLAERLSHGW